jgi:hypothetical protein
VINAPPQTTQVEFNAPTGDRYLTAQEGNRQVFTSQLGGRTQGTVDAALGGLQQLAQELNQPDSARMADIRQRGQDYYDLQAEGINADADTALSRTRSDLSKRFGGAYNASFGADLLARIENNRIGSLSDARKDASLYAEDLQQSDEASRLNRFTAFQNYLADLNNQAQGYQSFGGSILQQENQRATSLAEQRASIVNRMASDNAAADAQAQEQRARALQAAAAIAMMAL